MICSESQVEVLYFAKSAEITGIRSETISVPQEIKALQLWNEIEMRHPGLADVRNQVIFAVRQEYVEFGDQLLLLQSGDEIVIIPPLVEDSAFEPPGKEQFGNKRAALWASLVAQWLRICLPMQGTRVRALVWEDPTCRGATGPVSHNY
ncbi:hypothetical protein J1605_017057 [Eschrichtius robustus]|uniref:Molybdopterin synthase sulfur carrier subunit n=1 Tax=Eschrichtius robustus TaxID=9764 RepID=A0AB34I4K3_ESCRO|nr:hypothetical protein J1605_017057 [Eschrichtius robustus]